METVIPLFRDFNTNESLKQMTSSSHVIKIWKMQQLENVTQLEEKPSNKCHTEKIMFTLCVGLSYIIINKILICPWYLSCVTYLSIEIKLNFALIWHFEKIRYFFVQTSFSANVWQIPCQVMPIVDSIS